MKTVMGAQTARETKPLIQMRRLGTRLVFQVYVWAQGESPCAKQFFPEWCACPYAIHNIPGFFYHRRKIMEEGILVYICLSDRAYQSRLSEFMERHYKGSIRLRPVRDLTFSDQETYPKGIVLSDRLLSRQQEEQVRKKAGRVLYLSAQRGIDPFQSGHEIAKRILAQARDPGPGPGPDKVREDTEAYRDAGQALQTGVDPASGLCKDTAGSTDRGKAYWISVIGTSGGVGKSTLAMAAAIAASELGIDLADGTKGHPKVLLLNMEDVSDWLLWMDGRQDRTLSEVILHGLCQPEEDGGWIFSLAQSQQEGFWFLPPCRRPDDLMDLTVEETIRLRRILSSQFDLILADMGARLTRPQRYLLSESDRIYFIRDPRPEGAEKERTAWQESDAWLSLEDPARRSVTYLVSPLYSNQAGREEQNRIPYDKKLYDENQGRRVINKNTAFYRFASQLIRDRAGEFLP